MLLKKQKRDRERLGQAADYIERNIENLNPVNQTGRATEKAGMTEAEK